MVYSRACTVYTWNHSSTYNLLPKLLRIRGWPWPCAHVPVAILEGVQVVVQQEESQARRSFHLPFLKLAVLCRRFNNYHAVTITHIQAQDTYTHTSSIKDHLNEFLKSYHFRMLEPCHFRIPFLALKNVIRSTLTGTPCPHHVFHAIPYQRTLL
jgi:hypothetical protein